MTCCVFGLILDNKDGQSVHPKSKHVNRERRYRSLAAYAILTQHQAIPRGRINVQWLKHMYVQRKIHMPNQKDKG
jgi:hypothetical protein